ncbi:MAG: YfiR family protein [Deltaproteobacteria bacterium]|nr:YfiR family protein [Deltaproteobacteria bacterium]
MASIIEFSRNHTILTFTSHPEYISNGISVGIYPDKNKTKMVINLTGSQKEGAHFPSSLLKLAHMIQ